MNFYIITLFPDAFKSYFASSMLSRAQKKGLIKIHLINPRDFTDDKHRTADGRPFGGGPGMVLKAAPILKAVEFAKKRAKKAKVILFSPSGKTFSHELARSWAKRYKNAILICGHYEGVDERIANILKAEKISIGPYTLTGGELPAMVAIDAMSRHILGVLGKAESLEEKHGSYPVYTRPETLRWKKKRLRVPPVLLSGNHRKIFS